MMPDNAFENIVNKDNQIISLDMHYVFQIYRAVPYDWF